MDHNNIDFDKLRTLAQTDSLRFEEERYKIIQSFIKSLPNDKQKSAFAFQLSLDIMRNEMKPEQFLKHCSDQMISNLNKVNELCTQVSLMTIETLIPSTPSTLSNNVIQFNPRKNLVSTNKVWSPKRQK